MPFCLLKIICIIRPVSGVPTEIISSILLHCLWSGPVMGDLVIHMITAVITMITFVMLPSGW